jgi:hypothetical protein
MVSVIQYGGRITDDFDQLLMDTFAEKYFHPGVLQVGRRALCLAKASLVCGPLRGEVLDWPGLFKHMMKRARCVLSYALDLNLQAGYELHRDERSGFSYRVPDGAEVEAFRAAIEALPVQVRGRQAGGRDVRSSSSHSAGRQQPANQETNSVRKRGRRAFRASSVLAPAAALLEPPLPLPPLPPPHCRRAPRSTASTPTQTSPSGHCRHAIGSPARARPLQP